MIASAFRSRATQRRIDRIAEIAIGASALATVLGIVLIFVFVFREALPILVDPETAREGGLAQLFSRGAWQPVSSNPRYSLLPLVLGSLKATLVAVVTAVPIAVLAALYTSEFAPNRLRELIKPVIELLAGIPSVVLGFFALIVLATWIQALTGSTVRLNALNAGMGSRSCRSCTR
jgi:phosphate transport system permease protein